jgi:hypothetical protein
VATLGTGRVQAKLSFEVGGVVREVELPHAPVGPKEEDKRSGGGAYMLGQEALPLRGGQCLWRNL